MSEYCHQKPKSRLIIKNFLLLKNIDITVRDITILIGEQASGKSLVCKLYYFLNDIISTELARSILKNQKLQTTKSIIRRSFESFFPRHLWNKTEFTIELRVIHGDEECDYIKITGTQISGLTIEFSAKLISSYKATHKKFQKFTLSKMPANNILIIDYGEYNNIKKFIDISKGEGLLDFFIDALYIPSGRSFFSTIKDNVFGFISENIGIDPFIKGFGKNYEYAKLLFNSEQTKQRQAPSKSFDQMSRSIIKGEILRDKDDYLIKGSSSIVSLSYASSGQQEAVPLLIVLKGEMMKGNNETPKTILVEEPEAHLYPLSQKSIVDIVFDLTRNIKYLGFIIATHSPYILACANNGILKNKGINVSSFLIRDGSSVDIIDDNGMINGSELDEVSQGIYDEFYSIIEKQQDEEKNVH